MFGPDAQSRKFILSRMPIDITRPCEWLPFRTKICADTLGYAFLGYSSFFSLPWTLRIINIEEA